MKETEKSPLGLLNSTDELRKLILEHPDLPLLVFAGEEANAGGEYSYMSCSHVSAHIGEFLDCQQTVNEERCYTEREDFAEDYEDRLYDEYREWDGSEQEWEQYVENKICEYDPYWKPCIILYVDN